MVKQNSAWLPIAAATATVVLTAGAWYYQRTQNDAKSNSKDIGGAIRGGDASTNTVADVDVLMKEQFNSCVVHMKDELKKMPQGSQLEFYALFKQASLGNAVDFMAKAPPSYDMIATAKYNAWRAKQGMPKTAAMQEYIDKAVHYEFTKTMTDDNDDDFELEGDAVMDMNGMGMKQSTLAELTQEEKEADAAEDERYPLHAAARENQLATLEKLLLGDGNHDPNELDPSGQTALHLAADAGHPEAIKLLSKSGANVGAADNDGISVLQAAVIAGHVETCRLLCVLGANPDQPDNDGDTPRECAKDDPVLCDILFRASIGQFDIDSEFQEELQEIGRTASAETPKSSGSTSREEAIAALDNIPVDLDDGDGDM